MSLIKFKDNSTRALETGRIFPPVFSDLFDSFFGNELMTGEMTNWVPSVNISETNNDFKIDVAVPGLTKEDFKIEIDNDVLSITGERKEETKDENTRYTRREFSYGAFKRSFNLPETAEGEGINAHFENGILAITIPKKDEAKRKPTKEIKIS